MVVFFPRWLINLFFKNTREEKKSKNKPNKFDRTTERESKREKSALMAEGAHGEDAKDTNQSSSSKSSNLMLERQQQKQKPFSPTRSTTHNGRSKRRKKTMIDASALPSARLYQSFSDWKYIATFASVALVVVTVFFIYLSLACLLYTSPSPRDQRGSRMPSSA